MDLIHLEHQQQYEMEAANKLDHESLVDCPNAKKVLGINAM